MTPQRPAHGPSVLVSGAGVAGLMAALELWRRGCNVQVIEKTATSSVLGDSFVIGPSALRTLRYWPDMNQRHTEIAYEPMFANYTHTGQQLTEPTIMGQLFKQEGMTNHPRIRVHSRPKLHAMLLEQLTKCGLEIEYENEVVQYFEEAERKKAGVVLKDGSRREADLVIAADGLRSSSSALILGHPVPAKPSGSASLRGAYPVELALQIPGIAERFPLEADGSSVWQSWAGGRMFGSFWRTKDQMLFIITYPDNTGAEESWNHHPTNEDVESILSSIPDRTEMFDQLIRAAPARTVLNWKIMWRDPQPTWTSPNGYVVQIGDAAHSFLPSSGNGGTQALEDAVSIAACVAQAEHIPEATRVHNLLRFERTSFIQAMGVGIRNAKSKSQGANKKKVLVPGSWLTEHDPEQYVEDNFSAALAHLEEGTEFHNTNVPKVKYQPWTMESLTAALDREESTILDGDWS